MEKLNEIDGLGGGGRGGEVVKADKIKNEEIGGKIKWNSWLRRRGGGGEVVKAGG